MRRAAMALAPVAFLAGCGDGCGVRRIERAILGSPAGAVALAVNDCPDGLARCEDGRVWVSRLARVPVPCTGPAEACRCPWESVAQCEAGCVADGVLAVMERAQAPAQLCAPGAAASLAPLARPAAADSPVPGTCDEGVAYRCRDSAVIDCAAKRVAGVCLRGCAASESSLDEGSAIRREDAFAILCSR